MIVHKDHSQTAATEQFPIGAAETLAGTFYLA